MKHWKKPKHSSRIKWINKKLHDCGIVIQWYTISNLKLSKTTHNNMDKSQLVAGDETRMKTVWGQTERLLMVPQQLWSLFHTEWEVNGT